MSEEQIEFAYSKPSLYQGRCPFCGCIDFVTGYNSISYACGYGKTYKYSEVSRWMFSACRRKMTEQEVKEARFQEIKERLVTEDCDYVDSITRQSTQRTL